MVAGTRLKGKGLNLVVEIIADMGASHRQSLQRAVACVWAASRAGANGIKVQMFTPEDMVSENDDSTIKGGLWKGKTLYDIYQRASLPYDWIPHLQQVATGCKLGFIATIYHPRTIPIAQDFGIETYKIASFEANWPDFIEQVARTKKRIIISTGSLTYKEIETAVNRVRKYHNKLTLLKCTSQYPAPIESMNLKTIPAMSHAFKVPVGLSDHTRGIVAPVVSVALGATVIEKHIKLDDKGLDVGFAIFPNTFEVMVKAVRDAEKSIGRVDYGGEKTYHRKEVNGEMQRTVSYAK